jgi:hypothetical protein
MRAHDPLACSGVVAAVVVPAPSRIYHHDSWYRVLYLSPQTLWLVHYGLLWFFRSPLEKCFEEVTWITVQDLFGWCR